MHPCSTVYTWVRPNREDASRIDRVYTPVSCRFSGCVTLSCPLSDHYTVVASFVLPSIFPIGRGLWKLNGQNIGEAEFRQGFETRYKGWQRLKPAFASTSQWWDGFKLRIKRYAIQYCVTRARRRREKFSKLCAEVKFGDPLAVIALQTYLDEKYHGARVRACVEAVEAEERNSLRFYHSVSSSAGDRRVPSVCATNGTVVGDPHGIVCVYKDYYSSLFARGNIDLSAQAELLSRISKTVSHEVNDILGRNNHC
ncbi:pol-like protein [Apostichopus japonicus]|uniref:Pol-like protein n=1 Tax=Stichopus japonicus TaxID=307972 RepID=A0A2G8JXS4_STIJA|nr:pol-like protein [Apostichopus japonicus]